MSYLTREQILEAPDVRYEDVAVPEWGGTVRVRSLSGAERDRFEDSITQQNGKGVRKDIKNIRAKLVALCVVDESGKRIFTEADVQALGRNSSIALDRVCEVAQRLNAMTDDGVAELAENLEGDPSEDSGSS